MAEGVEYTHTYSWPRPWLCDYFATPTNKFPPFFSHKNVAMANLIQNLAHDLLLLLIEHLMEHHQSAKSSAKHGF